ncbi:hypothetical protein BPT24_014 [Tenacibaculum phage pT24]|uniref:Uncharacterized protein n=1 Tax=Tenacibaculum phage pT24 TaxID=1880590 RepID=A0A1B4XWE6_9CAUD|nr:hypothetical protein HYP10_gp014 [Tenacibaculum phage pT24]BAV39136.1 hypothetical protein BPT24_014 [Tenacibaculum phage pT24]
MSEKIIYINDKQSENIDNCNDIALNGLNGLSYDEYVDIETPNFKSIQIGETLREDVEKQLKVTKMEDISICLPLNELYRLCETLFFDGVSTDSKSGNSAKKFSNLFKKEMEKIQL